jgi:hypothetical protein
MRRHAAIWSASTAGAVSDACVRDPWTSGCGAFSCTIDTRRLYLSGVRSRTGLAFGVPELLFQNIRKGYNEYVPPGERPPPG